MHNKEFLYSSINSDNRRLMNVGNKALQESQYSQIKGLKNYQTKPMNRKMKTQQSLNGSQMDSLQRFQEELDQALFHKKNNYRIRKAVRNQSRGTQQTSDLKRQVQEIKLLLDKDNQMKGIQNRLEKMLKSIDQRNLNVVPVQTATIFPQQNQYPQQYPYVPFPQPSPYMMPYPMYPPPEHSYYPRHRKYKSKRPKYEDFSGTDSEQDHQRSKPHPKTNKFPKNTNPVFSRQRARNRLRKIFFVVTYTIFIKHETKKLSSARKSNLRKFWNDKFQSQMNNVKNWLLESFKYSLSIILEKGNLNFKYFHQKSDKVRIQKEKLLMQVLNIGISKLFTEATPQKISLFTQLLYSFCFRGSFAIGKFWTAFEMQQLCISENYGFIRADEQLQKFLIGVMFFIKVFTFNMLVQPHKFDAKNFPKKSEPLTTNMRVLGSVFYYMIKQIVEQYRNFNRDSLVFKPGNWLQVHKDFIVECSEPLTINNSYPSQGEYISGLFSQEQIQTIKELDTWTDCKEKLKKIIQKLHTQMHVKAKLMRKNLKYKLYH